MSDILTPEDQNLINRIKQKVNGGAITLMQEDFGMDAHLYPPAPVSEVEWVEASMGMKLPALIKELFLQVGNGGFGPGYGITGLQTGMKIYEKSFVDHVQNTTSEIQTHLHDYVRDLEQSNQLDKSDLEELEEEKLIYQKWLRMDDMIWYCYWGCNVITLVDHRKPELPVYWVDSFDVGLHSARTLRQWWQEWLDGTINQY